MGQVRTLEMMKELFNCAKLDESLSAIVRPVQFTDGFVSGDYKLFEVDTTLADELCNPGSNKVIELKAEPGKCNNARVFACTAEKTYSVLETETSNSLLLVPDGSDLTTTVSENDRHCSTATVQALKTSYLELQPCIAPSLRLLRQRMLSSRYHGPVDQEYDADDDSTSLSPYFTRADLSFEFPCSPSELSRAFWRLRIFQIDGFMRLVDPDYLIQVIRDIFSCADENAWDWRRQGFPVDKLLNHLEPLHNPSIVKQIIGVYFSPRYHVTGPTLFVFPRNSKICQLMGEQLLSVTNSFDLTDFQAVWQATVPSGLRPKLRKHLTCAGRAFCRTSLPSGDSGSAQKARVTNRPSSSRFKSISLLRSEDLPDESVNSRLEALFERCAVWPETELASYLIELIVPPSNVTMGGSMHSDPALGPLTFADADDSQSDFEYVAEIDADLVDPNSCLSEEDIPKPVPATVGAVLSRLCRVTTTEQGRVYTQKYSS